LKNSPLIKQNRLMKYFSVVTVGLFIITLVPSCTNIKNLQYLQGNIDSNRLKNIVVPEVFIQKGDLLGITVYSDDPQSTAAVTRQMGAVSPMTVSAEAGAAGATGTSSATSGFLVNQQGELQLYKLGRIPVIGLTKEKLADTLALLYEKMNLLKNPYVEVRFLNYKITVIGEVTRPGSYSIPTDKVSAFEAVGLAGDITVFGRRDNILVIREVNGVRQFGRVDLTKTDAFLSPYYYLQQNDLVIVDVNKNKAAQNNQTTLQAVTIGASLLSIIAVFVTIFRN
jgi:polysaccharide biosynthesis/export protein